MLSDGFGEQVDVEKSWPAKRPCRPAPARPRGDPPWAPRGAHGRSPLPPLPPRACPARRRAGSTHVRVCPAHTRAQRRPHRPRGLPQGATLGCRVPSVKCDRGWRPPRRVVRSSTPDADTQPRDGGGKLLATPPERPASHPHTS